MDLIKTGSGGIEHLVRLSVIIIVNTYVLFIFIFNLVKTRGSVQTNDERVTQPS